MDDETKGEPYVTTSIRVRADVWRRLRQLAHVRALESGGRASASAVIAELVSREADRKERADA